MTKIIKKFLSFISGKPCYKKPTRPVEHYAVYQSMPSDNDTVSDYQIKYGWHKSTAKRMKVGDYALLPDMQSQSLYQEIVNLHGKKSAKTKAVSKNLHRSWFSFRKVTRIK